MLRPLLLLFGQLLQLFFGLCQLFRLLVFRLAFPLGHPQFLLLLLVETAAFRRLRTVGLLQDVPQVLSGSDQVGQGRFFHLLSVVQHTGDQGGRCGLHIGNRIVQRRHIARSLPNAGGELLRCRQDLLLVLG